MNTKKDKQEYISELERQWGLKKDKPDTVETTLTQFKAKEIRRLAGLKMTKAKQNKFIDLYSQFPNMTKCARQVGISLQGVRNTINRDPEFKALVEACRDNISEDLIGTMVLVGSQPDARGANDRHRFVQAFHPAFKKTPDTVTNIQVNLESSGAVKGILSRILPNDD